MKKSSPALCLEILMPVEIQLKNDSFFYRLERSKASFFNVWNAKYLHQFKN